MNFFEEYLKNYDLTNDKIARIYSHTMRVKVLCEMLAKELGLNKNQITLVGLCGLYHDIARFEQIRRFDSFNDLATVDHGDLGYQIFVNEFANKLNLSEKDTMIVAKSILYHNKFEVDNENEEELLFTNIVRDADKIDILYQCSFFTDILIDEEMNINNKVHNDFIAHRPINYKNVTNHREKNILILAYIWDINLKESYKIIKDNKYYKYIRKVLNDSIYDEYFEIIENFLEDK